MVVADGLAPFSSQGICNNLDDISHLVRSVCVCVCVCVWGGGGGVNLVLWEPHILNPAYD